MTDPELEVERRLRLAAGELRQGVAGVAVPERPRGRGNQPMVLAAAAVLVVLAGLGANRFLIDRGATVRADGAAEPGPGVADAEVPPTTTTGPALVVDPPTADPGQEDPSEGEPAGDEDGEDGSGNDGPDSDRGGDPDQGSTESGGVRRLTAAEPGEAIVPLPVVSAWNADESRLVLYRTGGAEVGHVVVDTGGRVTATPDIDPPDIEQVYWHPTDPDLLLHIDGTSLAAWDVMTGRSTVLHHFAGCDRVDAGRVPHAPTSDGVLGLLCHDGATRSMLAVDLGGGGSDNRSGVTEVARRPTESDLAPRPSPSGRAWVARGPDGTGVVLDHLLVPTGIVLGLDGSTFVLVADGAGREYAAAANYDTAPFGTLVLHPLDGGAPTVLVGPDAGHGYPPTGTALTASAGPGPSVVVASIAGPANDATPLAGRVLVFDLAAVATTGMDPALTIEHEGGRRLGYWSTNFVAVSPSGRTVAWSSDQGTDRVDTFVADR